MVDVRDPSKKSLTISARIDGLQPGEVTLEFLNARENLGDAGKRIGSLNLVTSDGESKRVKAKRNRFRFQNDSDEAVDISYQLKSDEIANLGKSTYLDERRCLLSSLDAFVLPETGTVTIKVSFVVPEKWRVVTLATPSVPESYDVVTKKETFFYLGEATGFNERIDNCAVSLAVEKDWPAPSRDTWRETRNQISYLQKLAGDWKPRSLFVVFLGPAIAGAKTPAISLLKGNAIFLIPSQSTSDEADDAGRVRYQLAEKMVGYFLPAVRRLQESTLQESLTAYLGLKTCLKTGAISKTEFLEKMSRELGEELSFPGFRSDAALPEDPERSRPSSSRLRQIFDFFAVDLALAFQGKQSGALIGALQKSLQEPRKMEGDWVKKLVGDEKLAPLAGMSSLSDSLEIANLLRPFGLVLKQIEIPHFSFDLSETFQVNRIALPVNGELSILQVGDRILAINQNRLLEPADLLKWRGSLRVGEDVTLTVERSGTILRLRETMMWVSYCQLAVNGLADSDKQRKLDQFLARELLN